MKNLILFFVLLLAIGCSRTDAQKLCIDKTSKCDMWKLESAGMEVRQMANLLIKEIDVASDKTVAVQKICDFVDKVTALDIGSLEYDRQRKIMQVIYDVFIFKDDLAHKAAWMAKTVELAYDLQIKILRWQREQIERLRPQKDVIFNEMDIETEEKYSKWRDCYITIVGSFLQSIRKIEDIELPEVKEIVHIEEYERIKMKMKEFHDRHLREDVFNFDGVIRREVAPMELK